MISQNIIKLLGDAMKARDSIRVNVLRGLSSEFKNAKINIYDPNVATQRELTEEEEIAVIRREVKKRKEAIEMYEKANATSQAESEKSELAILQEFLPPEISDEDLEKIVLEIINEVKPEGMKDMGKVISAVKAKVAGADGAKIAAVVKRKIAV